MLQTAASSPLERQRTDAADDYIHTLEFMRSDKIVAPWYNNYYSEQILDVKKYDDHTISVTSRR